MIPFLKEVAQDILTKYKDISKICIIFPNKRAGVFFRKYFGQLSGHTIWSPAIFTIDKLVQYATRMKTADRLGLIFDLYEVFRGVQNSLNRKDEDFTFDKFYHLGETILNDINELDSYLIDVKHLFANIKDVEQYGNLGDIFDEEQQKVLTQFWKHFSVENASVEKQKFMDLWEMMPLIYEKFSGELLKKKYGYNGLIYRQLYNQIQKNEVRLPKYETFIFAGFNALNKAEEPFFEYLHQNRKAIFYWDSDAYYQFDNRQEAGMFVRRNAERISNGENWPPRSRLNNTDKNVQLVGVPLEVAQSKLIPYILEQTCGKDAVIDEDTAVVLADEHLLFPVLHSLPASIEKINVTMGYPIKDTSLFGLLNKYLDIQSSLRVNENDQSVEFFYKDVISILRQPDIWEHDPELATAIIEAIEAENKVYVPTETLTGKNNNIYKLLFTRIVSGNQLLVNVLNLLYELYASGKVPGEEVENTIEDEYIYQIYLSVKRLKEVLDNRNFEISVHIGIKILLQMLSGQSIPFSGEPLQGIQIMGMLETRNLDFKNVIILGVNEGICPATSGSFSLITEQIRSAFRLPNIRHADAMYAYYFYRLLQRAENVTMVYNNVSGYNNLKEVSRFVYQLKYESNLNINELQFRQDVVPIQSKEIIIEKNDDILKKLNRFLLRDNMQTGDNPQFYGTGFVPLSASAINTWIDCRLKFYFKYVARIKEAPKINVEVDAIMFGNILHKAIEVLYNNFVEKKGSKIIEAEDFDNLNKIILKSINEAFAEYFENEEGTTFEYRGNQLIIREVLKKHLKSILFHDKKLAPFTIISLENERHFPGSVEIDCDGKKAKVALDGTLDRVDKKDGIIRIVDYKTGASSKEFSSIEELFDSRKGDRKRAVMQIFFYGMLYRKNDLTNSPLRPSILKVRDLSLNNFDTNIYFKEGRGKKAVLEGKLFEQFLPEYEEYLSNTLSEIYNRDISFSQSDNSRNCMYCPYNLICGR